MISILAAAWFLAAPAVATPGTTNAAAPQTPAPKTAAVADPMVCRSETPIGSKLPVKSCIRKSERELQKRDSQEALKLIQRRSEGPATLRDPP